MDVKHDNRAAAGAAQPTPWLARASLPLLICGSVALAFSPILVRLSEVGPIATAANRVILALPFYFIWMAVRPGQRLALQTAQGRKDWLFLGLAGVFFAGDLITWHWSIRLTSVANSTVLANLTPVFVVIASWLLFRETVSRLFIAGLVTALAGVITLMLESLSLSATTLGGDAIGVVTSWFYAGYLLVVARVRQRAPTASVMGWGGLACAVVVYVLAIMAEEHVWPQTLRGWMVAGGLALVTQVIGQTLIALSFSRVPATFGSMVLMLQPAIAALVAWVLFDEPLSVWQAAGGIAILAGIEVARRGTARGK